jgi:hypothetical protein
MAQSPELAGGAGFTFADQVATQYLASLLTSAVAPGLIARNVSRVALEQRAAGEVVIAVGGKHADPRGVAGR